MSKLHNNNVPRKPIFVGQAECPVCEIKILNKNLYHYISNHMSSQTLAISTDFLRACRRLLMILGSPGGDRSFKGPFLIARKVGPDPSVAGKTKQSM